MNANGCRACLFTGVRLQTVRMHLQGLEFKGQMLYCAESDCLLFLASPLVDGLDALTSRGLFISDIPIHDATRDIVLVGEQSRAQVPSVPLHRPASPSRRSKASRRGVVTAAHLAGACSHRSPASVLSGRACTRENPATLKRQRSKKATGPGPPIRSRSIRPLAGASPRYR